MDYKQSPHYSVCTSQEKRWFDSFVETRDLVGATYAAYKVTSDDSARAYGKSVMSRPHIQALIDEFCTIPKPLPTVEDLKRMYIDISELDGATPREKLMALNSYERLCGFAKDKKAPVTEEFDSLDDIKE